MSPTVPPGSGVHVSPPAHYRAKARPARAGPSSVPGHRVAPSSAGTATTSTKAPLRSRVISAAGHRSPVPASAAAGPAPTRPAAHPPSRSGRPGRCRPRRPGCPVPLRPPAGSAAARAASPRRAATASARRPRPARRGVRRLWPAVRRRLCRVVGFTGTARPRPYPATAVLTPTTRASAVASAPPELPGLSAASVWMTSSMRRTVPPVPAPGSTGRAR